MVKRREVNPLPMDIDAEAAVIGACLAQPELLDRTEVELQISDFQLEKHKRIYGAMQFIRQQGGIADVITVAGHFDDRGELDLVGGLSGILGTGDEVFWKVLPIEGSVRRVKEKSIERRRMLLAESISGRIESDPESAAEQIEELHRMMLAPDVGKQLDRPKSVRELVMESGGPEAFTSTIPANVPTPFGGLNTVLSGGFRNGELIIVAARTSEGKSALAAQIASYATSRDIAAVFYPLEMGPKEIIQRSACCRSLVSLSSVKEQYMNKDERGKYYGALTALMQEPFYIHDKAGLSIPKLRLSLKAHKANTPVDLVVIDYLQLMEVTGKPGTRAEAVGEISRRLKVLAREFNVPFIVLSQLSRAAEDRDQPELRDLRESGSIEQDADIVLFLAGKTEEKYMPTRRMKLIVAKQRNGPLTFLELDFTGRYLRFDEAGAYDDYRTQSAGR